MPPPPKKEIPRNMNKVTTGVCVTPPLFLLIRKHHDYVYLKKKLLLLSYICYYTSEKFINTHKKDTIQISKVSTGIYITTPNPFCNILTHKKNVG